MRREMSVAGGFYPRDASEIEDYFKSFSTVYDKHSMELKVKTKSIIVPHAGYVYSGYTANIAYRLLAKSGIKNFLVVAPSHRVSFNGVSLCGSDEYVTPLGNIQRSEILDDAIIKHFGIKETIMHAEHSSEVQFPFIKHYIADAKIVELVYARTDATTLSKIIDMVLSLEDCGVIISTDLSHFYNLKEANKLDNICIDAIKKLDVSKLHDGCEACGILGVEAMILSALKKGLKPILLDYRTSSDASGDESSVVGYMSACFA